MLVNIRGNGTIIQLIKYTFVGGLAFIVDIGILFCLTEYLDIYYLFSAAVAFLFGLLTNYIFSVHWVFEKRAINNRFIEFFIFSIIGLIGLSFNELFMWLFTDIIKIQYLKSKFITSIIIFLWNFFVRKYVLFK